MPPVGAITARRTQLEGQLDAIGRADPPPGQRAPTSPRKAPPKGKAAAPLTPQERARISADPRVTADRCTRTCARWGAAAGLFVVAPPNCAVESCIISDGSYLFRVRGAIFRLKPGEPIDKVVAWAEDLCRKRRGPGGPRKPPPRIPPDRKPNHQYKPPPELIKPKPAPISPSPGPAPPGFPTSPYNPQAPSLIPGQVPGSRCGALAIDVRQFGATSAQPSYFCDDGSFYGYWIICGQAVSAAPSAQSFDAIVKKACGL